MRALWLTWGWPTLILLSTIGVALLTFWFPQAEIRPIGIMCFLFLIPGMTIVRFFRMRETAVEWMLAIALSFSLDACVAGILLYARQWSPIDIMSFLIGFCFSGAIAQMVILHPASTVTRPVPLNNKHTETTITNETVKSTIRRIDTLDPEDKAMETGLEESEDPEETRPAISLRFQQSHLEDPQEKTVPLKKPAFASRETAKG